jgi:glycerophosphoryl diester phosphodiesterase
VTDQARAALAASHRTAEKALDGARGPVRLVAHRGAGHELNDPEGPPENTLEAVRHGFEQGADAVEVDVWRTADGVVVLHHDRTTDRTTDLVGADITGTTYERLRGASAGSWKHPRWSVAGIPTLTEAASLVPADRALLVEVEEGPAVVAAVLAATDGSGLSDGQLVYISKNLDTAGELKRQAPRNRVLWIVDTTPRWQIGGWAQGHRRGPHSARRGFDEHADVAWMVQEATRRGLDGLDTMFVYPPDLPATAAEAGLLWMVWTANDPRAVDVCLRDGAWAITTDNTAAVRGWLHWAGLRTVTEVGGRF